jgi:hypothetical protein
MNKVFVKRNCFVYVYIVEASEIIVQVTVVDLWAGNA